MTWKPDYVTSDAYKHWARINDAADDVEIALQITAASRAVDNTCYRQFGQLAVAAEWFYTAEWDRHIGRWIVRIDDVTDTTGIVVKVSGTATTGYTLEPRQALAKGKAYTQLVFDHGEACTSERDAIGILDRWGWTAYPSAVQTATLLQTSRFMARRDSPFGIAGSPADGSEVRLLARVDPDVAVGLAGYVRWEV